MSGSGYCTVDDVRRVMQETDLSFESDAFGEDNNQIVVDAIASISTVVEKATNRHWYESGGLEEDDHDLVPTSPNERDDEHDIQTGGAHLVGEAATPKTWNGSYTRIDLERKDVESVSELLVRTPDGYVDWTAEYDGGPWPDALGDDYYTRINNDGVSHINLDTDHLLDDDSEPLLDSYSNAVYLTFSYGHDGLPDYIRRGVALLAASEIVLDDEFVAQVPDNVNLVGVETQSEKWARLGVQKLEPDLADPDYLEQYL